MSKTQDPSITVTNEFTSAVKEIILTIPRAKRKDVEKHITLLQKALNITEDLINYTAQGKHWANRSEGEVATIKEQQILKAKQYVKKNNETLKQARAELRAQRDKKYKVEWRGQGSEIVTLSDAAKVAGISEHALRLRLHRSKHGLAAFNIDDQVVTVYKPKA